MSTCKQIRPWLTGPNFIRHYCDGGCLHWPSPSYNVSSRVVLHNQSECVGGRRRSVGRSSVVVSLAFLSCRHVIWDKEDIVIIIEIIRGIKLHGNKATNWHHFSHVPNNSALVTFGVKEEIKKHLSPLATVAQGLIAYSVTLFTHHWWWDDDGYIHHTSLGWDFATSAHFAAVAVRWSPDMRKSRNRFFDRGRPFDCFLLFV